MTRNRRGSMLPALLALVLVAGYAGLEAGTNWDAILRREREQELEARLARLQRAVEEAGERLGHPPRDLAEIAALEPRVLPRVPLDPFTGTASWRLVAGADARVSVRSASAEEAFDGTAVSGWEARRAGSTWRVERGAK